MTTSIGRMDKPQCNKTRAGSPSDCKPVKRQSNVEFFSVPFDSSKKFHRTYGQLNAGFNDANPSKERYVLYHSDRESLLIYCIWERERIVLDHEVLILGHLLITISKSILFIRSYRFKTHTTFLYFLRGRYSCV